jgi:hypothetical protein
MMKGNVSPHCPPLTEEVIHCLLTYERRGSPAESSLSALAVRRFAPAVTYCGVHVALGRGMDPVLLSP